MNIPFWDHETHCIYISNSPILRSSCERLQSSGCLLRGYIPIWIYHTWAAQKESKPWTQDFFIDINYYQFSEWLASRPSFLTLSKKNLKSAHDSHKTPKIKTIPQATSKYTFLLPLLVFLFFSSCFFCCPCSCSSWSMWPWLRQKRLLLQQLLVMHRLQLQRSVGARPWR